MLFLLKRTWKVLNNGKLPPYFSTEPFFITKFPLTNVKWHSVAWPYTMTTLHRSDLIPIRDLITELWEVSKEHLRRVWYSYRGRLLLREPGPIPFWTCTCSTCWDQSFSPTCRYLSGPCTSKITLYSLEFAKTGYWLGSCHGWIQLHSAAKILKQELRNEKLLPTVGFELGTFRLLSRVATNCATRSDFHTIDLEIILSFCISRLLCFPFSSVKPVQMKATITYT